MEKIQKELKSIETKGIQKAMKEVPAKAPNLFVTFLGKYHVYNSIIK
jgi:hypothetical protein